MSHPPKTRSSSDESGTTSLIFGERFSVRLPRRTVPIWVSDPIGLANPLRTAITPAIVVVLTAPRPTSSTPSLPRAGAMSIGLGMEANYIATPPVLREETRAGPQSPQRDSRVGQLRMQRRSNGVTGAAAAAGARMPA